MSRTVSAVVTSGARCLGVVGPFPVEVPWWPEVAPIAAHLREVLGVPAFVLRLLRVDGGEGARDGHVTYHVEAPGATRVLRPFAEDVLEPEELRAAWARPDGLRELLDWAEHTLAALGRPVTGPVEQRKTWNLAGLFRLPTAGGPVWLKAIAAFAADEGRVMTELARVSPGLVPAVLATAPGRLLMSHVPGEDSWAAAPEIIASGVRRLVAAQATLAGPVPWLPDRRTPAMVQQVHALLDRGLDLSGAEVAAARGLLARWSEVDSCGLPDTVVHGDFHSGNMRGDGGPPVVLDFADAYYGNPVIDGTLGGPVAKNLSEAEREGLAKATGAQPGDCVFFAANKPAEARALLGAARVEIARRLDMIDESAWSLVWVVDAPLFEEADTARSAGDVAVGTGRWTAVHHAFTSPNPDWIDRFESDPGNALSYAYDIVCNGIELGGGSIRIHSTEVQERVFEVMGLSREEANEKFGFLLEALRYGPPPHGGIAIGWDRTVMVLTGERSMREVIAFPKTGGGFDPLTNAPAPITAAQRKEAGVDAKPAPAKA